MVEVGTNSASVTAHLPGSFEGEREALAWALHEMVDAVNNIAHIARKKGLRIVFEPHQRPYSSYMAVTITRGYLHPDEEEGQ